MHSILATSLVLSLALFSTAALNPCSFATNDISLTEAQLIQIAPQSKSCDDAPAKGECATAKTAADSISQSFNTYKVTNKAEQVAILSLMAFESNDFKYNNNHSPVHWDKAVSSPETHCTRPDREEPYSNFKLYNSAQYAISRFQ
jgi:hypothetical protein